MPKSKKYTSKIYKVKKSNLKKSKKGGFSWSDISNWKPDFTDLKSKFTDKMNNFSIFKKKDTQCVKYNLISELNVLLILIFLQFLVILVLLICDFVYLMQRIKL